MLLIYFKYLHVLAYIRTYVNLMNNYVSMIIPHEYDKIIKHAYNIEPICPIFIHL